LNSRSRTTIHLAVYQILKAQLNKIDHDQLQKRIKKERTYNNKIKKRIHRITQKLNYQYYKADE